jgi:hypothetical protein
MAVTKYYIGPTNSGVLIGIVVALCCVTGVLVLWRLAFRFSRRTLGLSDLLLTIGLVRIIFFRLKYANFYGLYGGNCKEALFVLPIC